MRLHRQQYPMLLRLLSNPPGWGRPPAAAVATEVQTPAAATASTFRTRVLAGYRPHLDLSAGSLA